MGSRAARRKSRRRSRRRPGTASQRHGWPARLPQRRTCSRDPPSEKSGSFPEDLDFLFSNSHFGFGGRRWRGLADFWGVEGTWSGRARWWPEEGQGSEKLGPGREHEIAGQALQVLEKAGAWPERLAGVPPGS